jgi:thiol-disulfide isomerase/thioredoxin
MVFPRITKPSNCKITIATIFVTSFYSGYFLVVLISFAQVLLLTPTCQIRPTTFLAAPPTMALTLQEIASEDQFNEFTSSASASHISILYFHTPWAAPCKQMTTILTTLASTYPSTRSSDLSFLSINAEELPEISETYDVTAVPFTVIAKGGKVLETVSGSDAGKVRNAVEKHAGTGSSGATNGVKNGIPPALKAEPQQHDSVTANGIATKNLSGYAPKDTSPQTANAVSDKEELNERLAKLVKAA